MSELVETFLDRYPEIAGTIIAICTFAVGMAIWFPVWKTLFEPLVQPTSADPVAQLIGGFAYASLLVGAAIGVAFAGFLIKRLESQYGEGRGGDE